MDLMDRILELSRQGYYCAQILAILFLETIGEENPQLVRAMGGLNGGIGNSGDICGCMGAGCCLISCLTGKPSADQMDDPQHKSAMGEFTQWFCNEMELEYTATDCRDIIGTNLAKRVQVCPQIIAGTYEKIMEILETRNLLI